MVKIKKVRIRNSRLNHSRVFSLYFTVKSFDHHLDKNVNAYILKNESICVKADLAYLEWYIKEHKSDIVCVLLMKHCILLLV